MVNRPSGMLRVFFTLATFGINLWGQANPGHPELQDLQQRVRELEEQHRAMLRTLEELRRQLMQRVEPAALAGQSDLQAPPATGGSTDRESAVRWVDVMEGESRMRFYGFLRTDLITDQGRPDNSQTPFFVLSEDASARGRHAGSFTLHPRLTRLGIRYAGPGVESFGSAKLSGQLEIDFQNGGRESRQVIRIRHAHFRLTHGTFSLLAGQSWDVISPLFPAVNNDTLMWNAGNLGDRRPQVTASLEQKMGQGQFLLTAGLGLTGAIDALDLDNNGFRDGEESRRPNIQARMGYSTTSWVDGRRAGFGIWGHRGWARSTRLAGAHTDFPSQSAGVDFSLPLHDDLAIQGEAWSGRNLSDVRGGIGQGINTQTGSAVRSRGGWVEASFRAYEPLTISPGFTIDDPRDEDLPLQARTRNRAWYIANRFKFGGSFIVGADYLRWVTDYKGLLRGVDNRFNLFMQYGF
ncbi:MAG: hypothetical protein HY315_03275 [Acidobacteria bacterium]|nr:hypothetical protein [Acidobacteriota bacterium]